MLTNTDRSADRNESKLQRRLSYRNRSVTISIPPSSSELNPSSSRPVCFTGPLFCGRKNQREGNPSQSSHGAIGVERREHVKQENIIMHNLRLGDHKNEHLLRSGQLGMCNDPYCTTCPSSFNYKEQLKNSKESRLFVSKFFPDLLQHHVRGWARKKLSLLKQFTFGVMNPHAKVVQQWNQFIVISCLLAIFIDPLFFYLLSTNKDNKCIIISWTMMLTTVAFRSMTDLIYFMHMLVQFRLAFISPESRVVGAGALVDHPKQIAIHYLSGFFFLDLFIVLPLPQIIVLFILPNAIASSGANHANNLLRSSVLVQYVPRLYRFLPLLAGQSPSGFIFESAWANFIINLLTFVLSGHVVGSCWYLLGLQRVNQCLRDACRNSGIKHCMKFIDCGHENFGKYAAEPTWNSWIQNENSSACFNEDGFPYGIYMKAVKLTTEPSVITRYVYSFFWGFQQISTLAGNQTPSYFVWEVLFTMGIIGLGLLLFALLIGNMQNFLQGLGRRRLERSLRRRDVEHWMSHRHLPEDLRIKVRESERYNWAATRGVNEERLMENLPEDVQRYIRRHLFEFIKKVRILALMDEPILDAICERLRQKTYIEGCKMLYQGGLVTNMVFIVRGKMQSIGEDGNKVPLLEGDVCGEELLKCCLEDSSVIGDTRNQLKSKYILFSNRTVECLTNVEAFVLQAADLEEVTSLFAGFLRNHRVQIAIRNESPYWRGLAATTIQVAWRYRKKRRSRSVTSHGGGGATRPSKFD
ncbi:probable cyclic nucleotide-gated ion channel 20, chloroplastic isoform X2 [Cynara cardunculus var. scolymus]|uniref:probable cyclic nucleotide-gated ion channel 20, chloroplastic isoform X2 n=1 Tax=Cynara cardunculus var. scolymus TaxID=59895 RepID=UPI000D62D68B|nr:probable cyclic nucleotide-gated ion channel 20, chloroplastic isoform X2 [Cynara cardunculus var. scolymus]